MHIAFETSTISTQNPTGIARYAMMLIAEIMQQTGDRNRYTLLNKISRLQKRGKLYRHPGIPAKFYFPALHALTTKFDILHSLDAFMPYWKRAIKITTIHDLFALRSDDESLVTATFRRRRAQNYKKIKLRSDAIITVSQNTKNDVADILGIPLEKIFVTHLGINSAFSRRSAQEILQIKEKYGIDGDYLLFVGTVTNRKNINRLINAYHQAGLQRDFKMVLAGPLSLGREGILANIDRLGLQDNIIVTGFVADNDLPSLYSGARGFTFPTLYEGFGIPNLEAMACGVPILTSNTGSTPELCRDHAVLVDPLDEEAIADGMLKMLATPQSSLERAVVHAQSFTWKRCAQQTLDVYRQLTGIDI
ncbi:MAG TPA: glycosyltransferase family 1 protein [Gammaproteobacteria bacterium]